jgi:hypothetical protein
MEVEDHVLTKGFSGLFTNDAKSASFDKFFMKPMECINEPEVDTSIIYKSMTCNRIREHYKDTVNVRWEPA